MQNTRDMAAEDAAAQHTHTSPIEPLLAKGERGLSSIDKAREDINSVDHAITALCDLLKASSDKVEAWSVYILLKPWQQLLTRASCDLNDASP